MKNENKNLSIHLNLKISNELFMLIDTLRAENLVNDKILPTRSEMVRILLKVGI